MTAKLGTIRKFSTEKKRITVSFGDWLDTGEEIASCTYLVTTVSAGTGAANALTVTGGSVLTTNTDVAFFVQDGKDNGEYTVHLTMTSTQGQIKNDHITVRIDEDLP